MKKALGYARVSGKTQATEGTGLEEQVAQVTEWARRNEYEIVEWFKDSICGELPWDKRPAMKALVARLAMNGVDAVLVHQLDRVARGKSGIFESFFEVAQAAGVAVISTIDGVLTDEGGNEFKSADAELVRTIKQAIVRAEKRKLVARMALGKVREKAKGNRTDGKHAFGSHPDKPEEQATLARMRQLGDAGLTHYRIAKVLDAEALRPRHATKWSVRSVQNILQRGKGNVEQREIAGKAGTNATSAVEKTKME